MINFGFLYFLFFSDQILFGICGELLITTTFLPKSCDQKVKSGDQITVEYTGSIDDSSQTGIKSKVFDSSRGRSPFDFTIGQHQVIKGWDEGLLGMCIGEKRTLILPPEYGYGEHGAGRDIPGGATLNFDVELLKIKGSQPIPNTFKDMDTDNNGKLSPEEYHDWFINVNKFEEVPENLFARDDINEDGFVSWDEFSGSKGDENDEL